MRSLLRILRLNLLPPAEFYDDVLREGIGVQQDGDEGGGEVEEAVFESGEED